MMLARTVLPAVKIRGSFILSIILYRYENIFLYGVINFVSFLSPLQCSKSQDG
jgi:hypothetical protein